MTLTVFMKKYGNIVIIGIIFIIAILLILFPPFGKMECKIKSAPADLSAEYKYTAKFSFWIVNDLTVKEVVSSDDKEVLENYKSDIEEQYRIYDSINSINNNIVLNDKSVVSTFYVNYDKLDAKQVKKLDNDYLKKKITIGKLKKIYKNNGASCHYK